MSVTASKRPLSGAGPIVLQCPTPAGWLPQALFRLDLLLSDHAHCEKKAAAHALSMIQLYPEMPGLAAQMARLAREESAHLARVLTLLEQRKWPLLRDEGDPYVQKLLERVRPPSRERKLDRFLVAGIVEARSCERLSLLAEGLTEPPLRQFYAELAQSEDGHQALFHRLACQATSLEEANVRLAELLDFEARLVATLPLRPAIH